jgi:hypothetical protein
VLLKEWFGRNRVYQLGPVIQSNKLPEFHSEAEARASLRAACTRIKEWRRGSESVASSIVSGTICSFSRLNQANTVTTQASTIRTLLLTFLLTIGVTIQGDSRTKEVDSGISKMMLVEFVVQKLRLSGSIIVA